MMNKNKIKWEKSGNCALIGRLCWKVVAIISTNDSQSDLEGWDSKGVIIRATAEDPLDLINIFEKAYLESIQ